MSKKCALVTGASRGIGRAIALALAANDYDVGVNYNSSPENAQEVCRLAEESGAKAIALHGNLANMPEIDSVFEEFLEEFGHIDLLVNNAGITRYAAFLEVTEEMWSEVTNIDWKASFLCAQRAARNMVANELKGVIINISSNQQDGCWPRSSVYGPSKAALNKFTRHAALELSAHGIRVNSIAPGYTTASDRNRVANKVSARLPLGRFAAYEEVAEAVVFLASDKAAYITGACLNIDGGSLLPIVSENTFISIGE